MSAIEAVEEALAGAGDADDALRGAVGVLIAQPGVSWAGIAFVEAEGLVLGPSAGTPGVAPRTFVTVCYKGRAVGELQVEGDADRVLLEAVAERISAHVLLGWDTAGETWEP